jgi:leucyl aminopeptidase
MSGVGKAADHPPALVVLSYNEGSQGPGVAWVGKGIVYDTGGLSIKTKTGMPGMKRDMGGAAAVLAGQRSLSVRAACWTGARLFSAACVCLYVYVCGACVTIVLQLSRRPCR